MSVIEAYTDGACKGNPGVGGWGWVEYFGCEEGNAAFLDYGGEISTTNNRMEMMAIIRYLMSAITGKRYIIYSDSQLCIKAIVDDTSPLLTKSGEYKGWLGGWLLRNYAKVKNVDLWKRLDIEMRRHVSAGSELSFKHVRGHSGNIGNTEADRLANLGVDDIKKRSTS